jgi:hypothetical protein
MLIHKTFVQNRTDHLAWILTAYALGGCSRDIVSSDTFDDALTGIEDSSAAHSNSNEDETSTEHDADDDDDDDDDAGEDDDEGNDDDGSEGEEIEPKFDLATFPDIPEENVDDCPCAENSDMIYTLDSGGALWIYNPLLNEFSSVGEFDCDTPASNYAMSLAVDAASNAWVHIRPSGKIFKVDTLNGNSCTDSGYVPDSVGFRLFGMAFVEKPGDGRCEQLYMHSADGTTWTQGPGVGSLGTLDPISMNAQRLGSIDYSGGEMTGTGDGRVFALAGDPAELIEYNPADASVIEKTPLPGIDIGLAFAFAFWGGDFYFFTDDDDALNPRTRVTRLDYDGTGEIEELIARAELRVVGAGVSVCAPLLPPK